jgi:hypothetical protein
VRHHLARPALAAAALAATVAASAAVGAGSIGAAAAQTGGRTDAASARVHSIFLIDGDQFGTRSTSSQQCVDIVTDGPQAGAAGRLQTLTIGGATYAFPAAAMPYLGRGLDPSLFNLNELAVAESGGRLPVQVHYTGRLPSLPGVTITGSGGGTARGYLTKAGAARFGTALARQFAAGTDRPDAAGGVFGSGATLALAGAATPAQQRPAGGKAAAKDTVTVSGTDISGRPADSKDAVFLFNADNSTRFDNPGTSIAFFAHGTATFHVPPGNYWAVGDLYKNLPKEKTYNDYLDVLPQFAVDGNTTVRVSAAAATSKIQAVVPRHVVDQATVFQFVRSAAAGPPVGIAWYEGDGGPKSPNPAVYVSPTSASPTVGTLTTDTSEQLGTQAYPNNSRYEYGLAYHSNGTIPAQRHVVRQASLATIHLRLYSDIGAWGDLSELAQFPVDYSVCPFPAVLFWGMHNPLHQTFYLTASPQVSWTTAYIQTGPAQGMSGGQFGQPEIYEPGEHQTQGFGAYPLHPAPNARVQNIPGLAPTQVSAGRAGNTLRLAMTAFSDSVPGHFGQGTDAPVKVAASYQIDQNGAKIAAGSVPHFFGPVAATATLNPSPSVIKFSLDTSQSTVMGPLSTATHTVWAWRSAAEPGATLPAGWTCLPGGAVSRACAVQPMMTLRYGVAGMDLSGATNAGQQVVHVQVGHLQLAREPKITGALVSVSFDGGKTWRAARMTGTGGSYDAVFNAPAGARVTLRTRASDVAGGSVTETIRNAYEVAS